MNSRMAERLEADVYCEMHWKGALSPKFQGVLSLNESSNNQQAFSDLRTGNVTCRIIKLENQKLVFSAHSLASLLSAFSCFSACLMKFLEIMYFIMSSTQRHVHTCSDLGKISEHKENALDMCYFYKLYQTYLYCVKYIIKQIKNKYINKLK